MNERPGFSIVIPAYNYARVIERALVSALRQDYAPFEVVVINDGSTDDTEAVLADLAARRPEPFRVVHQDNAGLAAVRNRGLREARHDWLLFLDADDELCPGALARLAETIQAHPRARLIIGGHEADDGARRDRIAPAPVSDDPRVNFRAYLDKRLTISNGACAMHRDLFAHTAYDPALRHTEDLPVFAHALARYPAAVSPAPVAVIHKHADSMRHDLDAALAVGMDLETLIFDNNGLPDWAQSERRRYRARRAISLLKLADRHGRPDLVRRFFRIALGADWRQALHPRYLRRYVASLRPGKRGGA
ncbi:MAG: glycosyltransferase family A protein [Alcanivorax sp.]